MSISLKDQKILQEIVTLSGDCLNYKHRCYECPFRSQCLPEFLNINPPTKSQRAEMALKILTHNILLDSDIDLDEYDRIKSPE